MSMAIATHLLILGTRQLASCRGVSAVPISIQDAPDLRCNSVRQQKPSRGGQSHAALHSPSPRATTPHRWLVLAPVSRTRRSIPHRCRVFLLLIDLELQQALVLQRQEEGPEPLEGFRAQPMPTRGRLCRTTLAPSAGRASGCKGCTPCGLAQALQANSVRGSQPPNHRINRVARFCLSAAPQVPRAVSYPNAL